jgi:gluconolactonase
VYRITKGTREVTLLTTELERPNGIGFSPDEKTLYVAQSDPKRAIWMSFPVKEDGTLGSGKLFYDATDQVAKYPGLPDGLSVDQAGNLWASGPGGIYVFNSKGTLLGRIVTGGRTSNCCFGEDGTTLFVTADSNLCRITTKAKGLP